MLAIPSYPLEPSSLMASIRVSTRAGASARVGRPVVRELVRPAPHIIGFRICIELHGFDGVPPLDEGFAHPMHSIHHRAVGGANDRIPQFCLLHEPTMRGKRPPRRRFVGSTERVVELLNLLQWDRTDGELPRQLDEAID